MTYSTFVFILYTGSNNVFFYCIQNGEVTKQLANSTRIASEATKERDDIKIQFEEIMYKHNKMEENIQQSSNEIKTANEDLTRRLKQLENTNYALQAKYDDLDANKSAEIAELRVNVDQYEKELKV